MVTKCWLEGQFYLFNVMFWVRETGLWVERLWLIAGLRKLTAFVEERHFSYLLTEEVVVRLCRTAYTCQYVYSSCEAQNSPDTQTCSSYCKSPKSERRTQLPCLSCTDTKQRQGFLWLFNLHRSYQIPVIPQIED